MMYSSKRFRFILGLVVPIVASGLILSFRATTALSAEPDQTAPATVAEKDTTAQAVQMDLEEQGAGAAASDPLAKVNNTDLKWTYFRLDDADDSRLNDYWIKGSWMFAPWLKFNYELHYQETDVTGSSENDWESLRLKPIFFLKDGRSGSWKYRLATGFEWILDFNNDDKGIGSGSDQIAPLFGVALIPRKGTTLVPLVQHFVSYNGDDINTTAFRFIGLQQLPKRIWTKLDFKVPVDWENDNEIPASAELEFGKMFTPLFGAYFSGLAGIGSDKPFDWGAGLNVRFVY